MSKIVAFSKAMNMVKIKESSGDVWYFLTPKVQTFISKFEVGQDVEFEVEENQGKKIINFISLKGAKTTYKKEEPVGFKCEDCGANLKDDKYKKCYTCNTKARANGVEPVKKEFKPYEKSPETQRSIRGQAIGNMTSRALIGLQGSYDINNVGEIIDTLFEHFDRNISKLEG